MEESFEQYTIRVAKEVARLQDEDFDILNAFETFSDNFRALQETLERYEAGENADDTALYLVDEELV
jgi:hypothetical protein